MKRIGRIIEAPPVALVEPVRRGRPLGSTRAGPHTALSVWLPNPEADRVIRLAAQQDLSVSKTIRQLLFLALR